MCRSGETIIPVSVHEKQRKKDFIHEGHEGTRRNSARKTATGGRGLLGFAIDIATRYRKSRTGSIAIANRDIDSEPAPYRNGCMKSVHKKQEMDG